MTWWIHTPLTLSRLSLYCHVFHILPSNDICPWFVEFGLSLDAAAGCRWPYVISVRRFVMLVSMLSYRSHLLNFGYFRFLKFVLTRTFPWSAFSILPSIFTIHMRHLFFVIFNWLPIFTYISANISPFTLACVNAPQGVSQVNVQDKRVFTVQ